ncbi:hypothetical protein M0R45_029818 [Rubus argutus]|uniref:F-box domain-containing protein n=1 Tax=Rubus argutus TaxID=59490 RepID=A0AAW1W9E0_RUBAR
MAKAQVAVDRFSALPPDVAHHILSFLPIAYVTRVSCVSKRCQWLHLSNPTLNFNSFPYESILTFHKRLELFDSLHRFLTHRGNIKIVMLKSLLFFFGTVMPKFGQILQDSHIEFPSCVFLCESLKYSTLDMNSAILTAPSFSTPPTSKLVSLSLRNVIVEDDEGFCKWVSCCRFIKKLGLERIYGLEKIAIKSSSLESLSIQCPPFFDINRLEISGDINRYSLNISASNLKYLKWDGNMLNHHLGEMNCLEEAEISLTFHGVNHLDIVCEQFLHRIRSVKVLTLDQETAKTLFREGLTPAPLDNVWYLHIPIRSSIDDNLVQAMVSLFRAVPNLTTLNVSLSLELPFHVGGNNVFGFNRGYWAFQGLDFISRLKKVTIELTYGWNGFELARFMYEHARNLKNMFVITLPNQASMMRGELWRTNRISNARVVFRGKRPRGAPSGSCLSYV